MLFGDTDALATTIWDQRYLGPTATATPQNHCLTCTNTKVRICGRAPVGLTGTIYNCGLLAQWQS